MMMKYSAPTEPEDFDNRHEHGVLPASHHGMTHGSVSPAQIAAIKAKEKGGGAPGAKVGGKKFPKGGKPASGHTPAAGGKHSGKHGPGGHKKGGKHHAPSVGKILGGVKKGIQEAAKAATETVTASTGTESVAKAMTPKHHFGFAGEGETHHFGHSFSYGGSGEAGGGIGA